MRRAESFSARINLYTRVRLAFCDALALARTRGLSFALHRAARTRRSNRTAARMAAPIHGGGGLLPRHRALLCRPGQHLDRDHPALARSRLRRRRAGNHPVRIFLGLSMAATARRMDVRSVRRTARARGRRRSVVARHAAHAAGLGRLQPADRDARPARPGRGRQLSRHSQHHRAMDAGRGTLARHRAQLQRHPSRHRHRVAGQPRDNRHARMARAVLHFRSNRPGLGLRLVMENFRNARKRS